MRSPRKPKRSTRRWLRSTQRIQSDVVPHGLPGALMPVFDRQEGIYPGHPRRLQRAALLYLGTAHKALALGGFGVKGKTSTCNGLAKKALKRLCLSPPHFAQGGKRGRPKKENPKLPASLRRARRLAPSCRSWPREEDSCSSLAAWARFLRGLFRRWNKIVLHSTGRSALEGNPLKEKSLAGGLLPQLRTHDRGRSLLAAAKTGEPMGWKSQESTSCGSRLENRNLIPGVPGARPPSLSETALRPVGARP